MFDKGTKTGSGTSMKNAQSQVIQLKYQGCRKWRARAAVRYPTGGRSVVGSPLN